MPVKAWLISANPVIRMRPETRLYPSPQDGYCCHFALSTQCWRHIHHRRSAFWHRVLCHESGNRTAFRSGFASNQTPDWGKWEQCLTGNETKDIVTIDANNKDLPQNIPVHFRLSCLPMKGWFMWFDFFLYISCLFIFYGHLRTRKECIATVVYIRYSRFAEQEKLLYYSNNLSLFSPKQSYKL